MSGMNGDTVVEVAVSPYLTGSVSMFSQTYIHINRNIATTKRNVCLFVCFSLPKCLKYIVIHTYQSEYLQMFRISLERQMFVFHMGHGIITVRAKK